MKNLLFVFLCLNCLTSNAQTSINDSLVYTDIVFTKANSPYVLNGNLYIKSKGSLKVEPGVTIQMKDNSKITIEGKVTMIGSTTDSIHIISGSQGKSLAKIVHDLSFPNSRLFIKYISINNFNNLFNYYGYNMDTIQNSSIVNCGIGVYGLKVIDNCLLKNNDVAIDGGHIINGCKIFSNNKAIVIHQDITLQNSDIFKNKYGLYEYQKPNGGSMMRTIIGNRFYENTVGMEFSISVGGNYAKYQDNSIYKNDTGLVFYSGAYLNLQNDTEVFKNNKICNNSDYNFVYKIENQDLNLRNVCWCTNDSTEIRSKILDGRIDLDLAYVGFKPYLTNCQIDGLLANIAPDNSIKSTSEVVFFQDSRTLKVNQSNGVYKSVQISNTAGNVVLEKEIKGDNVNLENMENGIYLIRLFSDSNMSYSGKILVY